MIYDSIIIGRGLIGSAAAKYISRLQKNVALVGPDEATATHEQIVFASHYDQARIQGLVGKDEATTLLNKNSAAEFASLEREAGIEFRSIEGCLTVFPENADFFLEKYEALAKKFDVPYRLLENAGDIKSVAVDFNFPSSSKGIYELSPAGHINPRLLIKAQQKIFERNGGVVINKTVKDVNNEKDFLKITTFDEQNFYAKKVLIAAGAFTNFFGLLKQKVVLKLKSESTIWVKVDEKEMRRLQTLPALLYKIDKPGVQDIYLIQPVKYPDGNYYLKTGANIPADVDFESQEDVLKWFRYEADCDVSSLRENLQLILPRLSFKDCFEKRCIVCYTPHGKPYIGLLDIPGLYIAAGGNGYAAMSSDALGKIAADVLTKNRFPEGFSDFDFRPVFMEKN